jgi:LacI family transcriptional regulator
MGKPATIKDVAKRAGVSITTVSFVLNKRPGQSISEPVSKRVIAAAQALQYSPRASAVGLAGHRTRNVGIVFHEDPIAISNLFHSHVVEGAVKETIERDYNLLFSYVEGLYRGPQNLPRIIQQRNLDGLVLLHLVSPKMIAELRERKIPVVAIDNEPAVKQLDTIQFDGRGGSSLAAEHLLSLGHERLAYLYGAIERPSIRDRFNGFKDALAGRGIAFDAEKHTHQAEFSYRGGYQGGLELLKKHKRVTGICVANDEMAAGTLRAARELGRRVPHDLSVVGFDDITMSQHTSPPLTTVRVDKEGLGRQAIKRLIELIEAKADAKSKRSPDHKREVLPVELVIRESTARPKR